MSPRDARHRFQADGLQSVSPERLVIMLYERAGRDLSEAREAILASNLEVRHRCLLHAQEIVEELAYAVQPEVWQGGETLIAIYQYLLELLVKANIDANLVALDEAATLIAELAGAWREAYISLQADTVIA